MKREQDIIGWAEERNIFSKATRHSQMSKTLEEAIELLDAINNDDIDEARDAIGDIIVTLVLQSKMWNLNIDECVEAAWNEIKDRKGKMVNGIFVKDS